MNIVVAQVLIPLCLLGQTTSRTIQGEKPVGEMKGRVVDGLGRPLEGVHVTIIYRRNGDAETIRAETRTEQNGRYKGLIDDNADLESVRVELEKPGYMEPDLVYAAEPPKERTLRRTMEGTGRVVFDGQENKDPAEGSLWYAELAEADRLVRALREILATFEWEFAADKIVPYFMKHEQQFRPAFRELVNDPHVGSSARYWLDIMADPRDIDLFPDGRKYAPDVKIQSQDLMEAIRETTRKHNFFSTAPEPRVSFQVICFAPDLNTVFIQCGINLAPFSGVTWRFVYRKVDGLWKLVSKQEYGRS